MEIEQYIQDKVKIYDNILGYIEGENDLNIDQSILSNRSDNIETLFVIVKVEQNHQGLEIIKKFLTNFRRAACSHSVQRETPCSTQYSQPSHHLAREARPNMHKNFLC